VPVSLEWLKILSLVAALLLVGPTGARAFGDWPQWRGPNRDGAAADFNAPRSWPGGLKEQWKVTVGVGHSSPLFVRDRIYVFARQGDEEVLLSLDAATGKEIWRTGQPISYEMHPAARAHGKGPKSTPVYSNGKLYTLGITGVLSAHDARDGRLLWRKDFSRQYPKTSPLYGTAMSPVVDKGLLIAHVGGHDKGALTAFDAGTGAVRWAYDADGPAYASPIVVELAGVRQVVTFTQKELVGISVADGRLLWKIAAKSSYDENAVTPIAYKDLLIFPREDQGIKAIRLTRQGQELMVQEVWNNRENELYMNTPVLQGNLLFGLSARNKGQLFSIDADTGRTLWQSGGRMGESGALLNAGKYLLLLTNEAKLIVLPSNATEYKPVAEYTVASSQTWAHPLVIGNRILVKDETTLVSFAV
jgi:outer membrane protein assembly factor BamB